MARRLIDVLVSPKVAVWCLACLIVLTFFGTLHQVDHGLHAAKLKYFDSYLVMIGFMPFPGTQLILGILTLNLLVYTGQLLFAPKFSPGIVMTHAGLLMLLLGGAITFHFAEEANLSLHEGEGSNVAASYTDWEVAFIGPVDEATGGRTVHAVTVSSLQPGAVAAVSALGATLQVDEFLINARAFTDREPKPNEKSEEGITRLEAKKPEKEPGANIAGGVFTVRPREGEPFQVLLFGEDTSHREFVVDGAPWKVALRRARHVLPVKVTLMDFKRELHPGTEMAKEYSSTVLVEADGFTREATISMNKPLRHRGYTLYQASFVEEQGGAQTSVFAVTRNYGRLLPYISTAVIVLGMIVHFTMMLVRRAGALRREARAR